MNKRYIISAFLCAAAVSFTSCIEENFENITPAQKGDEIVFGVRAGFENSNSDTRTVYSGEIYTVGAAKFERIDWVEGDRIEIYSPQALNADKSHYKVVGMVDGDESEIDVENKGEDYASLERYQSSGLHWGDGTHYFYAMYPSQTLFEGMETTLQQGVKMEGTTLRGYVPGAQPATLTLNGTDWTAAPDMKYAYMAAKSTATKEDGSVSLTFVPIVTAVQIQMVLSSESTQPISIAEIQVAGNGIAGAFTADLSDTGWPEGQTYPNCANDGSGNGAITISTWKDSKPITIEAGGSLTFTVFLRPGADYRNLRISYSPTGAGLVGKTMGSDSYPVNIPRNLKTVITGFNLPATKENEEIVIDASRWMDQLAPETQLKKLSIPGTGGSFSYNYNSSNPSWYKQQTLTLDEQWTAGIRAFEIVSDRPSTATTTLGTQDVKCNKVSMGITVIEVLEDLLEKTASTPEGETGPTECAVLILTYQPEGVVGNARNAVNYASSLKLMYDGLTDAQKGQIIQYKPDLTLADAKGKVMIFCRINQKDEADAENVTADDGETVLNAFQQASAKLAGTNITLIDGCGTGKDRWGSRGYKVKGTDESGNTVWNVAYDAANTGDETKSVDYYLIQPYRGSFPDWNNVKKPNATEDGALNFGFSTNYSNVTCWYQEWARVVPQELIDQTTGYYYADIQGSLTNWFPSDYRWYESYNEKLAAAKETFNMAISDTYPSYVFINSLCGYLVDSSIESSYTIFTGSNTGGIAGNIKGLADKLNPAFYQYVLGAGMEQTTGPTGIVMMDYVTNKPTDGVEYDGSYYLPGVIISNNFKHGSGNSGNTGGTTGGGSGSGDNNTEKPGGGNTEEGM